MGERGLLILLLAGFCVPAYNQIRKHVFVNTQKSWSAAQTYCRKNHIDLATVRSQEEAQQLLNIAGASLSDSAWIGLYRDGTQNWQWSNGDDVIYKSWTEDLFCASINSVGQWEDRVCSENIDFMCYQETSIITERYTLIEELKTWTEAQQYCREHHTDLVSIKNASENEELVKKAQGKTFWIGLFNEPWKWSRQGDNYTFHYWDTGEPNNKGGNDKCVRVFKSGTWGDKDCSVLYPFFCYDDATPSDPPSTPLSEDATPSDSPSTTLSEDPKTTSPPSTPVSQDAEPSSPPSTPVSQGTPVPEDLHLISHSMVWSEAWRYCKNHYTDLVNLTSLAAQNRVSELVRNSTASQFWIGLHRSIVYDNWYWVAGEDNKGPVNYTNWAPGEPNNPYYEHCGQMVLREDGGAEWNDLCCYEKLPFICFKD